MAEWVADTGPTDIENLTLVCQRDHQLIHHGGWDIDIQGGTVWWIPPEYLDPTRTPVRNTAHDLPTRLHRNWPVRC